MNISKFKKNIDEEKIKSKKTISLIGKNIATDWKILIGFLFVVLCLTLLFSWNTYKTIENQSFLNEKEVNLKSGLKVNTEQLDRVMKNLNEKQERFDNLTGGMSISGNATSTQ